jgi:hypothetical protein
MLGTQEDRCPTSCRDGDLMVLKMIFRELATTVLSTEIVDSQNVPNGTDLRHGVSAAYSNENGRPDIKTKVEENTYRLKAIAPVIHIQWRRCTCWR